MVKILVADENIEQNLNCCRYLSNSNINDLKVIGTNNGISTLNKYFEIKPNVFILDSHFYDMDFTEIIKRISTNIEEKKNCNIIITTNTPEEQLSIVDTSKIYKIFPKPYSFENLLNTINQMCSENKYEELNEYDIQILFLRLNMNIASNGTEYLIEAIKQCYYFPNSLQKLDEIFDIIAYKYNVSSESVRSCVRNSLKPLNTYRNYNLQNPILKFFDSSRNITPKLFLEVIVTYLHKKQKNKK